MYAAAMLDIVTFATAFESTYLLFTSYSSACTMRPLTEVMGIDTSLIYLQTVGITNGGACYLSEQGQVACNAISAVLGGLERYLPWMAAAFQAFYGLTLFSSALSVGWYTAAHKGWSDATGMADLRVFTLTVMTSTTFIGVMACTLGLAALLPPMMDEGTRGVVDVVVGNGELITMALTAAMGYLTLAFCNLSHAALREMYVEGQLILEVDEEMEARPLLNDVEKGDV